MRDPGHHVGRAGAGGRHAGRWAVPEPCISVRSHHTCLLVPHVDSTQTQLQSLTFDLKHGCAHDIEKRIDSVVPERLR
jgi:hypothetical protein